MKPQSNPTRPSVLRQWVRAPGSLSWRLAALGHRFEVRTLRQGPARLHRNQVDEVGALGCGRMWVREVILLVDGQALIWARSVSPRVALGGPWKALLGLGSRPLADLLFKEPRVTRSALHIERLHLGGPMRRRMERQWAKASPSPAPRGMTWARSSVFYKHGAPLRVMEAFSPLLAAHRLPKAG